MTPERELGLLRLMRSLGAQLDEVRDEARLLRKSLREAREFFVADEACLVLPLPEPAKLTCPGRARVSAINSFTDLAGSEG